MIESLELCNFRSIQSTRVTLQPLNVLVGANGSGKSNLVKGLEFLSQVAREGLAEAVSLQGGANGIVPKVIPQRVSGKTVISLSYRKLLPPLLTGPRALAPSPVDHTLQLRLRGSRGVEVIGETLTFYGTTQWANEMRQSMQMAIHTPYREAEVDRTRIQIRRLEGGLPTITPGGEPPPSAETLGYWFGMPFLADDPDRLQDFLGAAWAGEWHYQGHEPSPYSFLETGGGHTLQFAPQYAKFHQGMSSIRRFDLLLGELRVEHRTSGSNSLAGDGANMPSVLRRLRKAGGAGWGRILRTLAVIAPHIVSIKSQHLRSGKEFVQFLETGEGRGVESWESSDGTLRALAIMLALETSPPDTTVLIEEPEQNMHPWAIRSLLDHIREVIADRNMQVILTTHSQQVLECVEPREVLIATRDPVHGTQLETLTKRLPGASIEMGEVGRMWVKGLLGGVPGLA